MMSLGLNPTFSVSRLYDRVHTATLCSMEVAYGGGMIKVREE